MGLPRKPTILRPRRAASAIPCAPGRITGQQTDDDAGGQIGYDTFGDYNESTAGLYIRYMLEIIDDDGEQ